MKKKSYAVGCILLLILLATSGCLDFFKNESDGITYGPYPAKIQYSISYGYSISCRGAGEFDIVYDCDLPEVLVEENPPDIIYFDNNYEEITLVNNSMVTWNISKEENNYYNYYNLGLTANIVTESFVVSDLNGIGALTIQGIAQQHQDVLEQYGHAQANETGIVFIDPNDSGIKKTAEDVLNDVDSSNSFVIAKSLFIWLKGHTYYKAHPKDDETIQTANVTKELGYGDCDDLSFLYISLCRSVGIPARFIRGFTVSRNQAVPHAWAEVFVGGGIGNEGWIPVECACNSSDMNIQINQNFAIETADHLRLFIDQGSNESLIVSLSGIKVRYEKDRMVVEIEPIAVINSYSAEEKELRVDENNHRYYI